MKKKISFVGAGNVAVSLAAAFRKAGHAISHVYAPTREHARRLADATGASTACSAAEIAAAADDFVIIAVPDDAIESVASELSPISATILHVSGSTGIEALKLCGENFGVLYPLQTFSKNRVIDDFSEIPLFVEAESDETLRKITELAKTISNKTETMDSARRTALHVAAVFACNFVNMLLTDAFDICTEHDINPLYLGTLVDETVRKAFASGNPVEVQTGPAKRGDSVTVRKHLSHLTAEKREIYAVLTGHIRSKFKIDNPLSWGGL